MSEYKDLLHVVLNRMKEFETRVRQILSQEVHGTFDFQKQSDMLQTGYDRVSGQIHCLYNIIAHKQNQRPDQDLIKT